MTEATQSPLVLGAMMFGTRIDERTSFALLDRFVERGGGWIDTADCYAFWASDTGLGGDSDATRGQVVLAWLLSRGIRPMLGGSKLDQLDSAFDGVELKLTTEQVQRLDAADRSPWASPYARQ